MPNKMSLNLNAEAACEESVIEAIAARLSFRVSESPEIFMINKHNIYSLNNRSWF